MRRYTTRLTVLLATVSACNSTTSSDASGVQEPAFLQADALHQEAEGGREQSERERPPDFLPVHSRWYAPGNPIRLPGYGNVEPAEYEVNRRGHPLNPYRQNPLKGDFPVVGDDIFLNLTVTERLLAETRRVPTPTGNSGSPPVPTGFFGDSKQDFLSSDTAVSVDVFKGAQAFKPVDWRVRAVGVYNYTDLDVSENGVVNVDPSEGSSRQVADVSLQEAFLEYHLADLSDRYDFVTSEIGILPFRSDFRGFIFDDVNRGVRLLGNHDNNKLQYNLVYFDMLDKDTNSLLNRFDDREQEVLIANMYRQDWPFDGYTTSLSFHYNHDHRGEHFDDNGVLVSPAPVGAAQENEIDSYYFGWAGDGHLGRVNVTHALYQAYGDEDHNQFAGRDVDIDAQLAALEFSYDFDWFRVRVHGLYASGDDDPRDGDGEGFDAILDAPNFAGGENSFFNREAIRLIGVNLTNAFSPLPDLQSSKFEGQSNFVNPGLFLFGGALQAELSPTWRGQVGASYMHFAETEVLEAYLQLPDVDEEIGLEVFLSTQYRPLLTNNVIFNVGATMLDPGEGLQRIYQSDETLYAVFFQMILTW